MLDIGPQPNVDSVLNDYGASVLRMTRTKHCSMDDLLFDDLMQCASPKAGKRRKINEKSKPRAELQIEDSSCNHTCN